mmetsp:Transcript_19771/g.20052  ORF Transcript_19771/g.20052 Transcript_19771/m.20052 type:complete len:222 (-) Transcript_19771:360-1025(-)
MCHDATNFYFYASAAVAWETVNTLVFLDTDLDISTGFNHRGSSLGADRRIELNKVNTAMTSFRKSFLPGDDEYFSFEEPYSTNVTVSAVLRGEYAVMVPLDFLLSNGTCGSVTAEELEFMGMDILIRVNHDTFPPIGSGYQSPSKICYNWIPQSPNLKLSEFSKNNNYEQEQVYVDDTAVGGEYYEYKLAWLYPNGTLARYWSYRSTGLRYVHSKCPSGKL